MEITTVQSFLDYHTKIRLRTMRVIRCIPADKIEWTYQEEKFTLGDLIRHIATIERYMYAETVQLKPVRYPGCGKELAEGYENVVDFMEKLHRESMAIFGNLSDEDLQKKCLTPAGTPITIWKWLRAMVEHEIHHRGQIYIYLGILGIPSPPIFGMTSEEVLEKGRDVL